jgi:hypothetical protein
VGEDLRRRIVDFFERYVRWMYQDISTAEPYEEKVQRLSKPAILALEEIPNEVREGRDLAALIKLTRGYLFDPKIEREFGNGYKLLLDHFKLTERELLEASKRVERALEERLGEDWIAKIYQRLIP